MRNMKHKGKNVFLLNHMFSDMRVSMCACQGVFERDREREREVLLPFAYIIT
jgi:hypothetical protein